MVPTARHRLATRAAQLTIASLVAATPVGAATYYVDFASGSDRASGLSPAEAWKRAPGDSRAGAGPRSIRLQPGDTILFRGGVDYRGTIVVRASGTAEAPIRYVGDGWGTPQAILDGSEPVAEVRPCRSSRDCGGDPDWEGLTRLSLPGDSLIWDGVFQQDQPLALASAEGPLAPGATRPIAGSAGRAVVIRPRTDLQPRFATGAGRVGFLLIAGGHVEIRGFRTARFAPASRFGPYAGSPLVQLQPIPAVRLAAITGSTNILHAPPVGPAIAGVTSGPM
jgi:hypothetical protein